MPDITIALTDQGLVSGTVAGDFLLGADDLATGNDLKSAVLMSLLTDRGWWADAYEPDQLGSRLMTLRRAKRSDATLLRARDFCREALAWLVEDDVASAVDVQTAWAGSVLAIGIAITQATGVSRFAFTWKEV